MSTKNEELLEEARDRVINLRDYEPGEYDSDFEAAWEESAAMLERLVDALEAATKPVTVNTVDELDALPRQSVIIIRDRVWQKLGGAWPYHEWQAPDGGIARSSEAFTDVHSHLFPLTVLHTPRQEGE